MGHDTPEMNTNTMEVNTKITIQSSRLRTKPESVIEKKMHANKYGKRKSRMSLGWPTCGKEKRCGMKTNTQMQTIT